MLPAAGGARKTVCSISAAFKEKSLSLASLYPGQYSTVEAHIPENRQKYFQRDGEGFAQWMLIPLTETEARDLLELIHARHTRGIIFCSQFEPTGWYGKFPEATIADAILDRRD